MKTRLSEREIKDERQREERKVTRLTERGKKDNKIDRERDI